MRLLKLVTAASSRVRSEGPTYDRNLNVEELVDWMKNLDKYVYYEDVDEKMKVKFVAKKMRGHASICWDGVQVD